MKFLQTGALAACLLAVASCAGGNSAMEEKNQGKECNAGDVVIENIMTRTSIRQFTSEPVSKDTLDILVKAGMAAPSAVNKQPWEFVVITERSVLDSLMARHPYSNLKTATAAIVVCGNMNETLEGEGQGYWIQDCSAATENILLAAHGLGLGAVWCGVYPSSERVEAVKSVLGMPEYITPLDIVTLGWPAQNPEPKDKWKPEKVHYQTW